ncbi:hypothetical protein [Rudanella paleaurantiibacter]|nr:hypothetical protein [Rudanella paleaurantiibacter]
MKHFRDLSIWGQLWRTLQWLILLGALLCLNIYVWYRWLTEPNT